MAQPYALDSKCGVILDSHYDFFALKIFFHCDLWASQVGVNITTKTPHTHAHTHMSVRHTPGNWIISQTVTFTVCHLFAIRHTSFIYLDGNLIFTITQSYSSVIFLLVKITLFLHMTSALTSFCQNLTYKYKVLQI